MGGRLRTHGAGDMGFNIGVAKGCTESNLGTPTGVSMSCLGPCVVERVQAIRSVPTVSKKVSFNQLFQR